MTSIAKLRITLRVSRKQLAYLCGTTERMVELWESGARRPYFGHQKILAELFGETPDECVDLLQIQKFGRIQSRELAITKGGG